MKINGSFFLSTTSGVIGEQGDAGYEGSELVEGQQIVATTRIESCTQIDIEAMSSMLAHNY